MPLNLDLVPGELTREFHAVGEERYEVYPAHPVYPFIWHTCLSINAMTIAVCVSKTMEIPDAGHLGLNGLGFDYKVRLPGIGLIDHALQPSKTSQPFIQVTFEWRKGAKGTEWAPDITKWMNLAVAVGFVELYEQNKVRIRARGDKVSEAARVIRNACSHNFKINITNGKGAELDGLIITPSDNGRPLSDLMNLGDFFVLAIRMFSGPKVV